MKRHRAQVGDLIQYRFHLGLNTQRIVEVVDNGAKFIVEDGYEVQARKITVYIPAEGEPTYCTNCMTVSGPIRYCNLCGDPLIVAPLRVPDGSESEPNIEKSQHPVLGKEAANHAGYSWCATGSK